jgi:hypothetical protein
MNKKLKASLIQIGVACFSIGALATSYSSDPAIRVLSPYLGLCSQPFWFHMAYTNRLWGAGVVACAYTGVFIWGLFVL